MKRNLKRIFGRPYETWKGSLDYKRYFIVHNNAMRFLLHPFLRAILISFIHPWLYSAFPESASRTGNFSSPPLRADN